MTRPIKKTGLSALGRLCSISASARAASNPCPPLVPMLRDVKFIRPNVGGA